MTAVDQTSQAPRSLRIVFWALVAAFAALVLATFFPDAISFFRTLFLSLVALCFVLGTVLLILAVRWQERARLRTFWILTGASTAGCALGSVLHNAFYALAEVTGKWPVLSGAMEVLEVAFFAIAMLACYFPACRAAKVNPLIALRHE